MNFNVPAHVMAGANALARQTLAQIAERGDRSKATTSTAAAIPPRVDPAAQAAAAARRREQQAADERAKAAASWAKVIDRQNEQKYGRAEAANMRADRDEAERIKKATGCMMSDALERARRARLGKR